MQVGEVWLAPLSILDKKLNAEDENTSLLAEAEYIFNNADEFLAGVEESELLAA